MTALVLTIGWILALFVAIVGAIIIGLMATGRIDLSRLLSEPNGDASFSRFQFLIFTFVVALSLFLVIVGGPTCKDCPKFPAAIPGTVLALLGISSSSYLVSKGIQFSNEEGVRDRPPSVTVTPGSVQLAAGSTQQFTAKVIRSDDQSVTWSIRPEVGSITAAGLYTAPAQIPQPKLHVQVRAESVADPNGYGTAAIVLG
jgi:hypothetical protein